MSESMDDGANALFFMEVQQRHMAAMTGAMPGVADRIVVEELKAIYSDYNKLLQMGAPRYPLYSLADVQHRMADTLEWIGRAYDSMRDVAQANYYYEKAADAFEGLGEQDSAARNRQNIAQLKFQRKGTVDEEFERLQTKLSSLPEKSLQHAVALVELGELYMRSGDDFASEKNLRVAIDDLEKMGYPDPSGEDPKVVLNQTVQDIMAGKVTAGTTQFETLTAVRGAYQRIYQCLSTIYADRGDLEEAAKYFEKFEQVNANELKGEDILQAILDRYGEV